MCLAAWLTHKSLSRCEYVLSRVRTQAAEQISIPRVRRVLCARTQFNLVAEFRQETITIGIARAHNLRGSGARNYVRGSDLLAQIAFNLVLVWPGCVRLHCALI